MTSTWRRYLIFGVLAAGLQSQMPRGLGRDVVFCLVSASGAAAIMVGVRRNRPPRPLGWQLMAAAAVVGVMGDAVFTWYRNVARIESFPSPADAFQLVAYPLLAVGLIVVARRRHPKRGPTAGLDSAIFTVALGLLSWVYLIEPSWAASDLPLLDRLVGLAYPLGDVLLLSVVAFFLIAARKWAVPTVLLVGAVGALLAADGLLMAAMVEPAVAAHASLFDLGWQLSHVLWGAAALHPAMRALSAPAHREPKTMTRRRLLALGAALLVGPATAVGEVATGAPPNGGPVMTATGLLVVLVFLRMAGLVRQLQDQAARLGELLDTDFVTGLANRWRFAEALAAVLGPQPRVAALTLIHLEGFTELNDALGNRTGDAILRVFGARLVELTGPGALVARTGEHAFGVLDRTIASGHAAGDVARRFQTALEAPIALPGLDVSVEVSVGSLLLPDDAAEPALALHRADLALAAARARPERTAHFGPELEAGGMLAPVLINDLAEALEHRDVILHYQPQVQLRTGRVLGVEALARWLHPRHGLLGPDRFIGAVEQTGLIGPVTRYVLDAALAQCARWRNGGLVLRVAVNLSARNLLDPDLVRDVRDALHRHGLDPAALELEITESSAMVDPRRSTEVLGMLAQLGVTLAVDDYGTGHSSLAYLQRLPVQRLKLDRSFVTGMVSDSASAAIVESTIGLARSLGMDVVAEGVEDDETLLMLRGLECHTAQGFGCGRPVQAALVPGLVRELEECLPGLFGLPPLRRVQQAG